MSGMCVYNGQKRRTSEQRKKKKKKEKEHDGEASLSRQLDVGDECQS